MRIQRIVYVGPITTMPPGTSRAFPLYRASSARAPPAPRVPPRANEFLPRLALPSEDLSSNPPYYTTILKLSVPILIGLVAIESSYFEYIIKLSLDFLLRF